MNYWRRRAAWLDLCQRRIPQNGPLAICRVKPGAMCALGHQQTSSRECSRSAPPHLRTLIRPRVMSVEYHEQTCRSLTSILIRASLGEQVARVATFRRDRHFGGTIIHRGISCCASARGPTIQATPASKLERNVIP
jgi:hypothetical protein